MKYDAIVIGAGPAGSTAAALLARAGRSVAIVEKSAFPRRKVCGEFISAQGLEVLGQMRLGGIVDCAGPEVREVAVYAGEHIAAAPMPRLAGETGYGRALGRERLDALLLEAAREAGAAVYQPWRVSSCERGADGYACAIEGGEGGISQLLTAPLVVAAHGSWDTGRLPVPGMPPRASASNLLAFKAHFSRAALQPHRMALVAFPGGYGGLVQTDRARVSFSCCIRRDALAQCRSDAPGLSAGAAVLAHVSGSCRGVREALAGAVREGQWLATGPLRPGVRALCGDGYFAVGNALGEAHPVVAEGISMAIQSAWLLCERLSAAPTAASNACWNAIARDYEAAYRRNFESRIRSASAFAALAMRPRAAAAAAGLLKCAPGLLALGARFAGKAKPLRASA